MSNEQKEIQTAVPLPLEVENTHSTSAASTTFRGLPISWQVEREIKPVITPNVFGEADREGRPGCKTNRILYEGQTYTKEGFYKAVFPDYKKYPFKVQFFTDDIYRLGGNQRARLQYHILAQRFPLVAVDEADKLALEMFAEQADVETAQRWLNRMRWPDGHEKMVTFGASLEVADKNSKNRVMGLWCYKAQLEADKAVYRGVPMEWETWARPIVDYLTEQREAGRVNKVEAMQGVMYQLYYQNGFYLTVPQMERKQVIKWAAQFIQDGATLFPLAGDMGSNFYEFTVDFDRDTDLKENIVIHDDMGAYNREQNAERNKEHGKNRVADRADKTLPDGDFTRDDLKARGYGEKGISNLLRDKLIVKTGRRTPERKYIYRKNSV